MVDVDRSGNRADRLRRIGDPREEISTLPRHNGRTGRSAERVATDRPAEPPNSRVPDIRVILLVNDGGADKKDEVDKQDASTYPSEGNKEMDRGTKRLKADDSLETTLPIVQKQSNRCSASKLHKPKEQYPRALEPYPCGEWMIGEKLNKNEGEDKYQSEGAKEGEIDIDLQYLIGKGKTMIPCSRYAYHRIAYHE